MVPGAALSYAYSRKMNQADEDCKREGISFLPLPFETFGGLHSQSVRVVSKIGRALAGHTCKQESEVISHLFQRLPPGDTPDEGKWRSHSEQIPNPVIL